MDSLTEQLEEARRKLEEAARQLEAASLRQGAAQRQLEAGMLQAAGLKVCGESGGGVCGGGRCWGGQVCQERGGVGWCRGAEQRQLEAGMLQAAGLKVCVGKCSGGGGSEGHGMCAIGKQGSSWERGAMGGLRREFCRRRCSRCVGKVWFGCGSKVYGVTRQGCCRRGGSRCVGKRLCVVPGGGSLGREVCCGEVCGGCEV